MPRNGVPAILALAFVLGCSESANLPLAQSDFPTLQASVGSQVVHRVSVGGPDAFGPGTDANFSLAALERADGSVTGEWHDQFAQVPGFGGLGIHVAVNCLLIIGNQAWVGGVITQSRFSPIVGLDAVTRVVDNGRSQNDPPDQISFSVIGLGTSCLAAPGYPLFPVSQGQAVVQ